MIAAGDLFLAGSGGLVVRTWRLVGGQERWEVRCGEY